MGLAEIVTRVACDECPSTFNVGERGAQHLGTCPECFTGQLQDIEWV
jgi:hypothetical protein